MTLRPAACNCAIIDASFINKSMSYTETFAVVSLSGYMIWICQLIPIEGVHHVVKFVEFVLLASVNEVEVVLSREEEVDMLCTCRVSPIPNPRPSVTPSTTESVATTRRMCRSLHVLCCCSDVAARGWECGKTPPEDISAK